MDDRKERQAALDTLSSFESNIISSCKESFDMLEAFEKLEIITEEEKDDANDEQDYSSVIDKLRTKVESDPNFFVKFCCYIQSSEELSMLAKELLDMYSNLQLNGQSAVASAAGTVPRSVNYLQKTVINSPEGVLSSYGTTSKSKLIESESKKLKEQIKILEEIPSNSEETKQSKLHTIRRAIKAFIQSCLNMGIEAQHIKMVLENLHTKDTDIVIDSDLYDWCLTELEKLNKICNPESSCLEEMSTQPPHEVNFDKEVVQNSLLACHLLDHSQSIGEDMAYPNSLHELNCSVHLQIEARSDKVSHSTELFSSSSLQSSTNSQNKAVLCLDVSRQTTQPSSCGTLPEVAVHQYLIAKGPTKPNRHVVYYLAFSSHRSLREWSESHKSFENGFAEQQKQLPIQFILEKLWEGASVVLTGFSFGGTLAQLCATHLWSLSQSICPELLEKNLLCITYGQPIISLPRIEDFAHVNADKSRFYAIYISDDIIPMVMRYLDPVYTDKSTHELMERFRKENSPNEIFQNDLSTTVIKQLITLQECNEKHTNMQRVVHHIERNIRRKIDEKFDAQGAGERVLQHLTKRRHRSSDGPRDSLDALQDLRAILRSLKSQRANFSIMIPYVAYVKVGANGLVECGNRDFEFPTHEDIKEDMFCKHNTGEYLEVLTHQYIRQPPDVVFREADAMISSDFVRPSVKKLEIHHFSHHKTASLSLDGCNLCFTSKFSLRLHKSESEYEITVDQRQSVSSRSIQIHEVPLQVPRDFENSTDSDISGDYQETEETAYICLYTHFGEFSFKNVEVKHKKFFISCRKQQVANLSIAEVMELSFLGALLERHPNNSPNSASSRCKLIESFFSTIVDVVPIESAFSCIANMKTDRHAQHLCSVLKSAGKKPPLSQSLFINAALAITKLRGEAIQFDEATTAEDLFHVFMVTAKKRAVPLFSFWQSSKKKSGDESKHLKWFGPDVASKCRNGEMVKYLQMTVEDAIKQSTGRIPAISGNCVKSIFEHAGARDSEKMKTRLPKVKSPSLLLNESRHEIENLPSKMQKKMMHYGRVSGAKELHSTKTHNKILLDFVKRLRSEELYMCIQILIAFMEEQVRIPISDFNFTVSYWQLLKLGLGIFSKKITKDVVTQYVSVSKHIRDIAAESGQAVASCHTRNVANSKYAGKLQFLLSSSLRHDEPMLVDEKFQVYSLESHLYWRFANEKLPQHQKFDDSTPLEVIEENWDVFFKDVGLSTIVPSHRRLIARWLKFSLMIHKLRSELSCHATVGVVGLVNSGKSTLVKELFGINAIETGTSEDNRTTVPFLYCIPGIKNFDVVDFPGVDDQDDSIADLVNLLRTLSQLVVFVVNYRNAHTQAAVEWYRKLNQCAIPHLICLTHGDRLYTECIDQAETEHDQAYTKKVIKKQTETIHGNIVAKASDSPLRSLDLFSLKVDKDSALQRPEEQKKIHDAGIKGVKDVGEWIIKVLDEHLKEKAIARMLKKHFKNS